MLRIDDRLIHGQVMVGWCPVVEPDHLILCNDEVANDEWSRQIYLDASQDYQTSICTLEETVSSVQSETGRRLRLFVVVESPKDVVRLLELGLTITKVVVGGMHFQPGKRKIEDYLYVDDEDCQNFRILMEKNVQLEGKDVPTCKSFDVAARLGLLNND
ncbi:PTS sugar transporter subunit IIB [bacterium]|nr:PTS sugar transporter subunit IIB [bacterium]